MTVLEIALLIILQIIFSYACYYFGYTSGVKRYHKYVSRVVKHFEDRANVTNIDSRRY